jgi:hypothetical protein
MALTEVDVTLNGQNLAVRGSPESTNYDSIQLFREVQLRFYHSTSYDADLHVFTVPWDCRILGAKCQTVGSGATTGSYWTIQSTGSLATDANHTASSSVQTVVAGSSNLTLSGTANTIISATVVVPTYQDVKAGGTITALLHRNSSETTTCYVQISLQILPTKPGSPQDAKGL